MDQPRSSSSGSRASNGGNVRIQDQVFRDKLAELEGQLDELAAGTHAEYVQEVKRLDEELIERKERNAIVRALRLERIEKEFEDDKALAAKELAERKSELFETLMAELEEKRKQIEHEYHNMDLSGDCVENKPVSTRKLRRRPNDPIPLNEKRQRKASPQVNYLATEAEIDDDLRAIGASVSAARNSQSPARPATAPINERTAVGGGDMQATMERGQLFFENKCYLRGQTVFVETSEIGRLGAVIQSITSTEVVLKTIGEHKRISVTLNDLQQGKALLKKRN